jgi:UDP-2,3-diacylglucosamine pyrophosphatase LpxH
VKSKLKFVLSDLHLGAGYAPHNPLEDFTADEQLIAFLQQIRAESEQHQREVELIINGDFFEFLQVPAVDEFDPTAVYPKEAYQNSSQAASVKRLNLIIKGHQPVFNALATFIHGQKPLRRLIIIKGNHDVNLYWPRVKSRLRAEIQATGARSSLLLFAEEFVSREKIYVEHGHQRAEKMNSYHDFLDPRHPQMPTQLYYPAGSHFIINFLNAAEREHIHIDSLKPMTSLIWLALEQNFEFAAVMLSSFIRHTPALVVSDFTPHNTSVYPNNSLLRQLEIPEERKNLAQRYTADDDFRRELHQQIQNFIGDANIANKSGIIIDPADIHPDPVLMGQAEQFQQRLSLRHAAKDIAGMERANIIIFGHTHHPVLEQLDSGHTYINTGCWFGKQNLTNLSANQNIFSANVPAPAVQHLPYARIDYNENNEPTATLLDFANNNAPIHTTKEDVPKKSNQQTIQRHF